MQQAEQALAENPNDVAIQEAAEVARQELRNLAATQTAIQAATANLPSPQRPTKQTEAVEQAFKTVDALLGTEPETALEQAQKTAQKLNELVEKIGDPEARRQQAMQQARELRDQQNSIAQSGPRRSSTRRRRAGRRADRSAA
ncbi:MAG: hypothetical protein R3B90_19835 [Planctomycetaceae bacterium]